MVARAKNKKKSRPAFTDQTAGGMAMKLHMSDHT
jgi:hypothetical protein